MAFPAVLFTIRRQRSWEYSAVTIGPRSWRLLARASMPRSYLRITIQIRNPEFILAPILEDRSRGGPSFTPLVDRRKSNTTVRWLQQAAKVVPQRIPLHISSRLPTK